MKNVKWLATAPHMHCNRANFVNSSGFSCPHGANISWLFPNTVSCVVTQFDSDLCSGFPRFEAFEVKAIFRGIVIENLNMT